MLIVTPLSQGAATYFLDGPVPGRWVGAGPAELGLDGDVGGPELRRVLRGQDPRDGRYLPEWPGRRRAGWDLTFAAPKSLSLIAALN
ncbi:MAG: relaxase domain-containing protein, partial [Acidimicrobiales bacterium]